MIYRKPLRQPYPRETSRSNVPMDRWMAGEKQTSRGISRRMALLDRRNADVTAYMVMFEVDDLDARMTELAEAQVRNVWSGDYPAIRGRHLHPGDIGGAIVSLDQTDPPGSWLWGGPKWQAHRDNSVVTSIAGYRIAADDRQAVTTMWSLFGLLHSVTFVSGTTSTIELTATDRTDVGRTTQLDQVTLRLV